MPANRGGKRGWTREEGGRTKRLLGHACYMHNPNGAECAALYYSRLESAAFFQAAQTASERRAGADAHAPARCQVTQIDHMAAEPTHGPHHPCSSSSWLGARGPLLASGRSSTAEVFT